MSNQLFIVSAIDETSQAESILKAAHLQGFMTNSIFGHQIQTAIRCLHRLNDMRHDNLNNQSVSDSEIQASICFLNDILNLK